MVTLTCILTCSTYGSIPPTHPPSAPASVATIHYSYIGPLCETSPPVYYSYVNPKRLGPLTPGPHRHSPSFPTHFLLSWCLGSTVGVCPSSRSRLARLRGELLGPRFGLSLLHFPIPARVPSCDDNGILSEHLKLCAQFSPRPPAIPRPLRICAGTCTYHCRN